ncbi:TonB-dependent receptor [Pseudoduganella namucuonensis]|uniref:Iron complex outermembrane recepter protein n=1 Tax=Pseudoduganella namucuonensis TaxID=1035707 RepID=A0A1I7FJI8_9BURK|nr:TonB-dependent receptor [Pseudoduganella namucuonensis]SFU36349.1 iron complex outermembrane recepter protein [Pseudoduganella namucuonensis]
MNNVASKRGTSAAFQLKPVAAGCAVFLALASNAYAQTASAPAAAPAADAPIQAVVVSGIRSGIEAAISIKKNSTSIVEAISAEDLGKLPDSSVAESIARLPGVTAQRSAKSGKAADISVRGLSPSFNGTLLNGREQASTGNARSPEFDLFPAELMGSVVIYKTPDAQLVGSGLAATIDLRTVQPLDFGKRVMAANYRKARIGVRSGGEEGDGDRYSFSYIDQFADRTIGLALGFTKLKETGVNQQKFNSWGGWAPTLPFNGQQVALPGGFTADTESSTYDRDGAMASLQFRPNKNFKSTLDFFYSSGSTAQKKTGLEGAIGGNANGAYDPAGVLQNVTVVNGVAQSGTLTNFKGVVRNHVESADDDLKTIGWNNQLRLNDWTLVADLTHSKATKQATRYETTAGQPGNATNLDTISWTGFNGSNFTDVAYKTGLNYGDRAVAKLTDVNGWSGGFNSPQAGYVALPHIDDKVDSIRLSAKRDLEWGPIVGTTFGFNHTKREKSRTGAEGRLVVKGGNPYGVADVPGTETSVAGTTGLPIVSFNPIGSLGTIYELSQKVDADILNKDWAVREKVSTAYIMGDLDGTLFGIPYRGNIGTQIVHTDQSSSGQQVDQAKCTGNTAATCPSRIVTDGKTYTDFLPSANVSFDVGNEQQVRMGLAKVLSRANLDDLRASQNFSVSTTAVNPILTGSGGNAKLDPFSAKSFDISYEKYFAKKAYFSVAGFYKKLDTYIFRAPRVFDFAPFLSPGSPLPTSGPHTGSTVGLYTAPVNGDGGTIKGFELSANLPLSMVSKYLDGFGVMANHSNTSSAITLPTVGFSANAGSAITIPLPGLSRQVSNLRLYYENHGIQVAAAARKRSNFLGQVSDFQDNSQLTFIKGETIVDLQASYEFQSGFAKGFTVYVQANNWNNAKWQQYVTDPSAVTETVKYGRTYYFGANYKF